MKVKLITTKLRGYPSMRWKQLKQPCTRQDQPKISGEDEEDVRPLYTFEVHLNLEFFDETISTIQAQ